MVRKLETAGLVGRRPSTQDARSIVVTLTDAGRDTIAPLKTLWQDLADDTVVNLTSTTVDQLIAVLTDLAPQSAHSHNRRRTGLTGALAGRRPGRRVVSECAVR
jgi:hypothetical protein